MNNRYKIVFKSSTQWKYKPKGISPASNRKNQLKKLTIRNIQQ